MLGPLCVIKIFGLENFLLYWIPKLNMVNVYESIKIYSTKPLNSRFRYKDLFQIYPSNRKLKNYHPIILQLSFSKPTPYYRYSSNDSDILSRTTIEKLHLLSLFTQFYFYGFSKRKHPVKKFSSSAFPEIKRGMIRWYQDKTLDDRNVPEIIVPDNIETLFDIYEKLGKQKYNIFRKSLYLFYSGVELKGPFPSQSFISLVSALETLIDFDNRFSGRCNSCGQPIYKVSKRFKDFILKYAYSDKETKSNKKFISSLYNKRSEITHKGLLLVADLFWDNKQFSVDWKESFLHKDLIGVTRHCLINWLIANNINS